jgi:hypothetical protein
VADPQEFKSLSPTIHQGDNISEKTNISLLNSLARHDLSYSSLIPVFMGFTSDLAPLNNESEN